MTLVFVTRQGCHLCEQALELVRSLGHQPLLADVDADDRLHDLYDWRVPVLMVDDRVVAEGKITREQVEKAIGRGSRPAGP
ncbi:MAG TPA: glutaredoxin family protein [Candidatus Dormibacteraeota bacterium]|nr:glutaredoxin family protein [Candidatus Dormibacteraeota bacterium]